MQETFTVKAYMNQEDQPIRRILQKFYYTVNKGCCNKSSGAVINAFPKRYEPPFMQLLSLF
jgi:N-acetyl-anhydromuramyl-L-alanine amidase AmpD